jgi:hypothetical protein
MLPLIRKDGTNNGADLDTHPETDETSAYEKLIPVPRESLSQYCVLSVSTEGTA